MRVDGYRLINNSDGKIIGFNVTLLGDNVADANVNAILLEYAKNELSDVQIAHKGYSMPIPEKIFRCGDTTTAIWKDGTKTTVKLMPGADDSDYGAFTAALAKKIYGSNSAVMRYAGMVQRVKSKAEKKAERKAKHKAESESSGEKKYIVSQYGQVAECKGIETDSIGVGEKVIVFANDEGEARCKAVDVFRKSSLLKEFLVLSDGYVTEMTPYANNCFGYWETSLLRDDTYKIRVFAKDVQEAGKVLTITPAPIPF